MGRNLNKDFSSWNDQDSAAIRSMRTACSLLASGGSSSSGCLEDFKAYLASKDKLQGFACTITHITQYMEMTEILVYLRGPLFLIFRQITPVSIKLFKKESSQRFFKLERSRQCCYQEYTNSL
jgi:hypothetical protein